MLEDKANLFPEVRLFVDAVCSSENGIVRPRLQVRSKVDISTTESD